MNQLRYASANPTGTVLTPTRPAPAAARWDLAVATDVANVAAREHHLPGPITLVRLAHTAVFKTGGVALKVVPTAHIAHTDVLTETRLITYLHHAGIPVPAPLWTHQVGDHYTVTANEFIPHNPDTPIPWGGLGQTIAALHALPVPDFVPAWTDRRPVAVQRLTHLVGAGLISAWQADQLVGQLTPITGSDSPVVINHGDVHTGNILIGANGLTLIDWELARAANPVMDLSGITNRAQRYGATARNIADFCAGYGVPDLTSLPGVSAWCASRDLNGITYLLGCPGEAQHDEGQRRLADVLNGTSSIWVDQ